MKSTLRLPLLRSGQIYERPETEEYFGTQGGSCDFNVVLAGFPKDIDTFGDSMDDWRDGEEVVLQYRIMSLATFASQVALRERAFDGRHEDQVRVSRIEDILLNGGFAFPIFVQRNDPLQRITEGNHRIVAFSRMAASHIPVFLVGYRDWFDAPAFE